jgi:hypothetical protein
MIQQFKDFWQRYTDTPFKGLRDRPANSTYFLICDVENKALRLPGFELKTTL